MFFHVAYIEVIILQVFPRFFNKIFSSMTTLSNINLPLEFLFKTHDHYNKELDPMYSDKWNTLK